MQLPPDIYTEISKHIPLESQARFRTVARNFSTLPFNWEKCCDSHTNREIADWLVEQSRARWKSSQTNNKGFLFVSRINPDDLREEAKLIIDSKDGSIKGGTFYGNKKFALNNREDISEFLKDYQLSYDQVFIDNFFMVRDILFSRSLCASTDNWAGKCFIKFLAQNMKLQLLFGKMNRAYSDLSYFINDDGIAYIQSQFEQVFIFNQPTYDHRSEADRERYVEQYYPGIGTKYHFVDEKKLEDLGRTWISSLTPAHLI